MVDIISQGKCLLAHKREVFMISVKFTKIFSFIKLCVVVQILQIIFLDLEFLSTCKGLHINLSFLSLLTKTLLWF
jgi:hypothetical protein